jgi:hypothetical protein
MDQPVMKAIVVFFSAAFSTPASRNDNLTLSLLWKFRRTV